MVRGKTITMRHIFRFFDKLEDHVRGYLSHYPMFYAVVGGFAIVVFWRGVWEMADQLNLHPLWSMVVSVIIMMMTGIFVSFFIPDLVILSGLKKEKKIVEKTEEEIKQEESLLSQVAKKIDRIEKTLDELKHKVEKSG